MKKIPSIISFISNITILIYILFNVIIIFENKSAIEMDIQSTHTEKELISVSFFNTRSLDTWLEGKWEVDELRYAAATYFSKWSSWTLGILFIYNLSFFTKTIKVKRRGRSKEG